MTYKQLRKELLKQGIVLPDEIATATKDGEKYYWFNDRKYKSRQSALRAIKKYYLK